MHYLGNCSSQDYFLNILQLYSKDYLTKIAAKCSIFLIVLFSYGKVKDAVLDKDQLSSGESKRKGYEGSI